MHYLLCPAAGSGTLIHRLLGFPLVFDGNVDQKRGKGNKHGHPHTCTHSKPQRFLFPGLTAMLWPADEGMACKRLHTYTH